MTEAQKRIGRMVCDLLKYYPTEAQKVNFLKNRIAVFLRGNRGRFFDKFDLEREFGIVWGSEASDLLNKALLDLSQDKRFKVTSDHTKIVYPREYQNVW